jgi:hypothetical protein
MANTRYALGMCRVETRGIGACRTINLVDLIQRQIACLTTGRFGASIGAVFAHPK